VGRAHVSAPITAIVLPYNRTADYDPAALVSRLD